MHQNVKIEAPQQKETFSQNIYKMYQNVKVKRKALQ